MSETNRSVFITGAVVNTGFAIAEKFARENYDIFITSRNEEGLNKAVEALKGKYKVNIFGYILDGVRTDNTIDQEAVIKIFNDIKAKGYLIDCVVLNAANIGIKQKIFENPLSDFINVINTNVVLNYLIIERAALQMKEKRKGSVIFVNSNTAYRAIPDRIAYSASKGAQLSMMRALALDLGKYNIRVNAVLPGMIKTDRWRNNYNNCRNAPSNYTPLGDIAEFEDIANAVFYFAGETGRNTTGAELVVDGGNMIQLYPIIPDGK